MSIRISIKRGPEDRQTFLRYKLKMRYLRRPTNNSVIMKREDGIKWKERIVSPIIFADVPQLMTIM